MDPATYAPLDVSLRFGAGLVAAAVATLAMDAVMTVLPEGTTPPSVAAGVLTDRPPRGAPDRLAAVVHYLAGVLTGPLFVWLLFTGEAGLGRHAVPTTLAAATVLYLLMTGFFVVVVLPQSRVAADRLGAIRRDWALSAGVYLSVVVAVVELATRLL